MLLGAALHATVAKLLSAAPPAAARLDDGRFTVLYYPSDRTLAEAMLASAVERDSFPWLPRATSRVVIMIAPDNATFRQWAGASAGPATAAVAFVEQHRIVMRGAGAPPFAGDPRQTLRHELAHVALFDYLDVHAARWFDEGYASLAAGEERNEGFLAVNAALLFRRMPGLSSLDSLLTSPRPATARAGYTLALRAVTDLATIDAARGLEPLLVAWKDRGTFDLALRRAYALTTEDFERDWRRRTRWTFAFLAVAGDSAALTLGVILLLGPVLLPAYLSRRREKRARLESMRTREEILDRAMRGAELDALLSARPPARGPGATDA